MDAGGELRTSEAFTLSQYKCKVQVGWLQTYLCEEKSCADIPLYGKKQLMTRYRRMKMKKRVLVLAYIIGTSIIAQSTVQEERYEKTKQLTASRLGRRRTSDVLRVDWVELTYH